MYVFFFLQSFQVYLYGQYFAHFTVKFHPRYLIVCLPSHLFQDVRLHFQSISCSLNKSTLYLTVASCPSALSPFLIYVLRVFPAESPFYNNVSVSLLAKILFHLMLIMKSSDLPCSPRKYVVW